VRLLILVLSAKNPPYDELTDAIRKTWGSVERDDLDVLYYYGNGKRKYTYQEGDEIYTPHEETYENIGYKTIDSFKHVLENYNFDYLFRTNSSSYLCIDRLLESIKSAPRERYYAGWPGRYRVPRAERRQYPLIIRRLLYVFDKLSPPFIPFASGSGYILSRDLVQLVVNKQHKWDHSYIDDVALGLFLYPFKIKRIEAKRMDVEDELIMDKGIYHYRLKHRDRETDVRYMQRLHGIYTKQQGRSS
jgi:hypothetical protein